MLGTVEQERAFSTVHEGAVYLHLGESYGVTALDLAARTALVRAVHRRLVHAGARGDETAIVEAPACGGRPASSSTSGAVAVTEQVVAYQRRAIADGERDRRARRSTCPETTFETEARLVLVPRRDCSPGIDDDAEAVSALHAAEHALISVLPLYAMCDRWDIGGLSTNVHQQTGRPTIFVYDGHPGGVGITERGFDRFAAWVADAATPARALPVHRRVPVVRADRRSAATSTSRSTRRPRGRCSSG